MLKKLALTACSLLLTTHLMAAENPTVLLTTSLGEIEVQLDEQKAPISTQNLSLIHI